MLNIARSRKLRVQTVAAFAVLTMVHPLGAMAAPDYPGMKEALAKARTQGFMLHPVKDGVVRESDGGEFYNAPAHFFGSFVLVGGQVGTGFLSLRQAKPGGFLGWVSGLEDRPYQFIYGGFNKQRSKLCLVEVQGAKAWAYGNIFTKNQQGNWELSGNI